MRARRVGRDAVGRTVYGIDRMVRNVETGRFERSLSALTAAGALVTAAEIYFEHDSASFGNKMMWLPVALGPVGAAAGAAGSVGGDRRQRPAGSLPARARYRPEAWRLEERQVQHGDGPAAAGSAAGHHGGRHGPAGS